MDSGTEESEAGLTMCSGKGLNGVEMGRERWKRLPKSFCNRTTRTWLLDLEKQGRARGVKILNVLGLGNLEIG